MNVSEPLRQETSSGKAAFMTQPCLSQPRPSGPRQRPRLCLSSPVPASATEGICGWETPSAPQAPIECRTAGPNTRPWGGVQILRPSSSNLPTGIGAHGSACVPPTPCRGQHKEVILSSHSFTPYSRSTCPGPAPAPGTGNMTESTRNKIRAS